MNNKNLLSGIFTLFLILVFQQAAFAGVYKWVDEEGQVHYGERPGNTEAEQIKIRHDETTKPRAIKGDEESAEGEGKDGEKTKEQVAETPAEPEEEKISKKEKRRLCNEAKTDVAAISSRGRVREKNAKGEYRYLTDEAKQKRLAAARKKQSEYCR